jgi:ABC-2 type transport system permease protein
MLDGQHLSRILMFMALTAGYGAFWFGLAALVNAMGARSATNALALMASWIVLVIVIPAGLNLAAKALYPLPSRIEMVQWLRAGDAAARKQSSQGRIFSADLLRKGEEEALEAGTVEFLRRVLPIEEKGEELAAPIFRKFEARKADQQELMVNLKYFSPSTITHSALNDLAENGAETFADYNRQVTTYQKRWRAYFRPFVLRTGYMSREQLANVPRFTYLPKPSGEVVLRTLADLGGLLVWFAGVLALGIVALRRYPADGR